MKNHIRFISIFLLALLFAVTTIGVMPVTPVYAASIVVNTLSSNDDGNCDALHCSLSEAVEVANISQEADTITFSVNGSIFLNSTLPVIQPASSAGALTIDGGNAITLSGDSGGNNSPDVRILETMSNSQVTLRNLTLTKATHIYGGGAILNNGQMLIENVTFTNNSTTAAGDGGGAINSGGGSLIINNSTFSNNSATLIGGAIYIGAGPVEINNSSFSNNIAGANGGALYSVNTTIEIRNSNFTLNTATSGSGGAIISLGTTSHVTITDTSFTDNQGNSGGAITNSSDGIMTISKSAIIGNDATGNDGGGIYVAGTNTTLTLSNSTLAGNTTVNRGGGIFAFGSVSLYNVTIADNTSASSGSGIQAHNTLNIHNTIIANHINGDCVLGGGTGVIGTHSNNLIESADTNACNLASNGNITGTDPNLGTLTGSPAYHPLNTGSAAIDSGDNSICNAAPVNQVDQRGISRPQGAGCDRGAYEIAPPSDISLSASSVTEGLPANTTVGTFTSTDADTPAPFTYSLVNGTGSTDNAAFNINGATLRTSQTFNFLTKNSYSIRVRTTASDGLYYEEVFTIAITDTPAIFNDVPDSYWAVSYIERLYNAGITGGCGTGLYCPTNPVTRAQMAVFLLKGIHGSSFVPPAVGSSTGFTDVDTSYWAAAWIKQLAAEAITGGCGSELYCPDNSVTRAQMAVFLLKAKHGSSYTPPTATGVFSDVATTYWAAAWIEQLAAEGITSGCAAGLYCPENSVTRDQMAVFLVKAFNLP